MERKTRSPRDVGATITHGDKTGLIHTKAWGCSKGSGHQVGEHVFVDETKENGLFVAAAIILPKDLDEARKAMRGLILPRQSRVHFCKENNSRRNQILSTILGLGLEAVIYDAASYRNVKKARDACLSELVADLAKRQADRLILELDDSSHTADKRLLQQRIRELGATGLRYDHMRASQEPLLIIPDALAWCWVHKDQWKTKVREMVTETRTL